MRVIVDRDLCEANGVCESIAPQVFRLDDADVLHILTDQISPDDIDDVEAAVRSCPKVALSLEE